MKRANFQQTEFVVVEYRIANLWHLLALGFLCVYGQCIKTAFNGIWMKVAKADLADLIKRSLLFPSLYVAHSVPKAVFL